MKILTIISMLVSLSFAGSLDSAAVYPFNMDRTKKVTMFEVFHNVGTPDTTYALNLNLVFEYSNLKCYMYLEGKTPVLYSIEITEGKVDGLEIGMSKRKILRSHEGLKEVGQHRLVYDCVKDGNKYTVEMKFENKKLVKMLIYS